MLTHPITREQFEKVRPLLDKARKHTRPRVHDLYDVFSAILYRQQSGCSWRKLPSYFPPWRTVHEYSNVWKSVQVDGQPLIERAMDELSFKKGGA